MTFLTISLGVRHSILINFSVMQKAMPSIYLFFIAQFLLLQHASSQQVVKEITIQYKITAVEVADGDTLQLTTDGASYTVSIKDNQSRTNFVNSLGEESVIYDRQSEKGVILKAYGAQHLMYRLNQSQWKDFVTPFYKIDLKTDTLKSTQGGYDCLHAKSVNKDGSYIEVYFHPGIIPVNDQYLLSFEMIKGIPIRVIKKSGKQYYEYTLTTISFDAISLNIFSEPKSGYRVLDYNDVKSGKN